MSNVCNGLLRCCVALVCLILSASSLAAAEVLLEEFPTAESKNWTFSNGPEFPGAKGSFEITQADKPNSLKADYCGKLHFDFSDGGAYVAAYSKLDPLLLQKAESEPFSALQLSLFRPEGIRIKIRVTDSSGQTFQKEVRSAADQWSQISTTLDLWEVSWGGKNDGTFHGTPTAFAILADKLELIQGAILFDEVSLLTGVIENQTTLTHSFQASVPAKNWNLWGGGKETKLTLHPRKESHEYAPVELTLDFSDPSRAISLNLPQRTLPGIPKEIVLKGKGDATGLKARLHVYTHFMTFYKELTATATDEGFEFSSQMPPDNDWSYTGGENDGKIHGPLRLGRIELRSSESKTYKLEDFDILLTSTAASDSILMQHAKSGTSEKEGELSFSWYAQSMASKPLEGKLTFTLKNWNGDILQSAERQITIPPKLQETSETFLSPLPESLNFLEGVFTFSSPGLLEESLTCTWLGSFPQNSDFSLDPDSPFGMGVYLYRLPTNQMSTVAQMAARAGVKWSREEFNWNMLEPRKGEFNWPFFDHLVSTAESYGIQVYGIAAYWTGWTQPYTEQGIQDYLEYLRACVSRYQGRIKHWEIWNEPNIFFWQGTPEMYADLLIRSYQLIKEIDPEIQVLGLSTAGIDYAFIDKMLEKETPFDILTIHPYRSVLVEESFIKDLQKADRQINPSSDGPQRPIWNTEMGWATYTEHPMLRQSFAPNSERRQAELLARTHLTTIASGVNPKNFWYNFRNDGDDPWYFEFNMGITRQDFSPKPAYAVFSTMTHLLQGTRFAKLVKLEDGTLVAAFLPRSPQESKTVVALWNPQFAAVLPIKFEEGAKMKADQSSLQINSTEFSFEKIVNAIGEESADSSQVSLPKGPPVYLILNKK